MLKLIRSLFAPPIYPDDERKTRQASLLNTILVALVIVTPIIFVSSFIGTIDEAGVVLSIVTFGLVLGLLRLMRSGHVKLASTVVLAAILINVTASLYAAGTIRIPIASAYVVAVTIAAILLDTRAAAVCAALSAAALFALTQAEMTGGLPPATLKTGYTQWVTYTLVLGVAVVLLSLTNRAIERAVNQTLHSERAQRASYLELKAISDTLEQRVAERTAQLQASAEVGRAATSILDENQLLQQITTLITQRLGFYYASVFLLDASGKWAVLSEASGPGDAAWVLKQSGHKLAVGGQSMVGAAIATRRTRIALDVGAEAVRFANPLLPDTHSEIALPLIVGDHVLGALDVQSKQAAAFDETRATMLQTMADQIAVTLNNAKLFTESQVTAQSLRALYTASRRLLSARDLQESLAAVADIASNTPLNRALLFMFEHDAEDNVVAIVSQATWYSGRGTPPTPIGTRYPQAAFDSIRLLLSETPVFFDDTEHDERIDAPMKLVMKQISVRALAVLPLWLGGRQLGALLFEAEEPHHFAEPEIRPYLSLADQLAVVVENHRLLEQTQRTLQELDTINRRLTGEAWQPRALGEAVQHEYRQGATSRDQPVTLSMQIPIELRGTPIGSITLEDTQRQVLTDDERALIHNVLQQMALALETQRLTRVAQLTAQRDRAVAETADKIHQPTNLDAILRVAVAELSRVTGISAIGVQFGFGADASAGNGHHEEAGV